MIKHLDIWTATKVRDAAHDPYAALTREEINAYTIERLKEQLLYVTENSVLYQDLYKEIDIKAMCQLEGSEFMKAFRTLPPTTPEMLKERETDFLCVSQSEISRIVTLPTSGSTGKPKRVYFTEEDQQLTVDFFNHGMRLICDPSDVVLILMPANVPGSIGKLLGQGLRDMGAKAIEYGLPVSIKDEAADIIDIMKKEKVTSIVALPTHMIKLAREAESAGITDYDSPDFVQLRSILLSAEYVPEETVMMLEETFECCIYEHYGMTEMGLGCAVSCGFGNGYHVRESDLFLEIVDSRNGEPMPEGAFGEIVFTTLTRKGMPFIRYRTGDFSRWITEPCMCGSVLKRIDKVGSRDIIKGMLVDRINGIK